MLSWPVGPQRTTLDTYFQSQMNTLLKISAYGFFEVWGE